MHGIRMSAVIRRSAKFLSTLPIGFTQFCGHTAAIRKIGILRRLIGKTFRRRVSYREIAKTKRLNELHAKRYKMLASASWKMEPLL